MSWDFIGFLVYLFIILLCLSGMYCLTDPRDYDQYYYLDLESDNIYSKSDDIYNNSIKNNLNKIKKRKRRN